MDKQFGLDTREMRENGKKKATMQAMARIMQTMIGRQQLDLEN